MPRCVVMTTSVGVKFTEEAVGSEEGERLAWLGGVDERPFRVPVRLYRITRLPVVPCPERLPLRPTPHSAAPLQPAIVRLQPHTRRCQIVGIAGERNRQLPEA